jgi:hypothetical protein
MKFDNFCPKCDHRVEQLFRIEYQPHCDICILNVTKDAEPTNYEILID